MVRESFFIPSVHAAKDILSFLSANLKFRSATHSSLSLFSEVDTLKGKYIIDTVKY